MKRDDSEDDFEFPEIGRKHPARQALFSTGNRSEIVFVTVCTRGRKRILACDDVHALLLECWEEADQWVIGRYVVMPDHLHLFCSPGVSDPVNVRDWVAFWKGRDVTKWPRPEERPIWLRDCWDTQLRKGDSYSAKWQYVFENPVRHGHVEDPGAWPYQGELNTLIWEDP